MKENTLDRAIWFAGGVSKLAKQLGVDHSSVSRWKNGVMPVPYKHRIQIEALTNGAIRAVDWSESA